MNQVLWSSLCAARGHGKKNPVHRSSCLLRWPATATLVLSGCGKLIFNDDGDASALDKT